MKTKQTPKECAKVPIKENSIKWSEIFDKYIRSSYQMPIDSCIFSLKESNKCYI